MPTEILDSYAVLSWLQDEHGGGFVKARLRAANRGDVRLAMSVINLGEVLYHVERKHKLEAAQAVLAAILEMPIEVLPASQERVFAAAHVKANHAVSYADAFAIAAAQELDAAILTGDPEFKRVERIVEIVWLSA